MKEQKTDVKSIGMTSFAERHFSGKSSVTQIPGYDPSRFVDRINNLLVDHIQYGDVSITEGAFPFSRLITLKNFTDARTTVMEITVENHQYLRTDYSARREDELPVLSRWFELPPMIDKPVAESISIALYSREQLVRESVSKINTLKEEPTSKEVAKTLSESDDFIGGIVGVIDKLIYLNEAKIKAVDNQDYPLAGDLRNDEREIMSSVGLLDFEPEVRDEILELNADWVVVAIMAHVGEEPEPMNPITIMRNALGKKEGGNGTSLDRDSYNKSVEFWRAHANVK